MVEDFRVIGTTWEKHPQQIRDLRTVVFIREQGVPEALEWEGGEAEYHYALAFDQTGQAIGTGRIHADGHIGRMAVLKPWRGKGVGSAILSVLLVYANQHAIFPLFLNAQTSATGFYQKHDFCAVGEVFFEAGIAHQKMVFDQVEIAV